MWNPDLYLRFAGERTRPSLELCQRIPAQAPGRILDAGCGPGNSTRILRERWPGARLTGLDSSPAMLAKARQLHPEGTWILGDLGSFQEVPYDLVFANAVLQWLPDHGQLLPRLMALVAPGGHLAVQVPANGHSPMRQAMAEAARHPRFGGSLQGAGEVLTFHDPLYYYDLLTPLAKQVDLWTTTYYHAFTTHLAILEWWESTGMRPYLDRLGDTMDQAHFKDLVLERCRQALPPRPDGSVLMPFERLFFVAYK